MREKIGELKNDYGMEIVKIAACIVITGILYCYDYFKQKNMVFLIIKSCHLTDALTGVLTFATLMIGFLGVLLPAVVSMRKDSDLISNFFKVVSPKRFSAFIRSNIIASLALNICSIIMFFSKDMINTNHIHFAFLTGWLTILSAIYFIVTTYSVLNTLLRLLIENKTN